jgi:hypothetical protein
MEQKNWSLRAGFFKKKSDFFELMICDKYRGKNGGPQSVNILGGSVQSINENAQALVVASKEIGLNVNVDITKYVAMSRDQNTGQSHSMKIDNNSFERVEEFKYLGTTLMNQNFIEEQIKGRVKSGNAFCHLVQNVLSSSLLSKNLKIKMYRTIILPVFFVWV